MKKILFFIPTLTNRGAEKILVTLMNNIDKNKYDITLLTLFDGGENKKFLCNEIKYRYVFKKIFRGNIHILKLFSPKFLYKKFIGEKYDIIISYLEGPTTRILSGCPYEDTKKINWVHIEIDKLNKFIKSYRSKNEFIKCQNKYDATVFVSKTAMKSFQDKTGLKNEKQFVLYNTIDTKEILKKSKEKIADIKFDKEYINLISVGKLAHQKGYCRLLNIFAKLCADYKIKLYIVGNGSEQTKLEEIIKHNKLENNVFLIGYRENPYKYVKNADLFVCSSYREGYSTAVTESIIVGTPVVTTLCSGMEEMLEYGKYGIIVENNDDSLYNGLKEILQNNEKLEYYKERAKERSKYFNLENNIIKVEEFIDKL